MRGAGKTLITAGVLVLLFVAYELWGTGVITQRAQDGLRQEIDRDGLALAPIPGKAVGFIAIPKIGLDMVFVQGTEREDLMKGPGHYSDTPLPGRPGNVGIAGHRTTYSQPFWALNELRPGDIIELRTRAGTFRYAVRWQRVVSSHDLWVVDPTKVPALTLTTCHPRFSSRERLVIRALQISGPGTPRGGGVS
jgi:sortase A